MLRDRAVSIGVGVPDSSPVLARAQALGIPVVRRPSGGSGVLHGPGDLVWSVVLPRTDPRVGRDFVRAYGRFGAGPVAALRAAGIDSAWTEPPGLDPGYCVLSDRGCVLRAGAAVLGGAAQQVTGRALLHHGFLPRRVDRATLRDVFALPDAAIDRLIALEDLSARASAAWAPELANAIARSMPWPRTRDRVT